MENEVKLFDSNDHDDGDHLNGWSTFEFEPDAVGLESAHTMGTEDTSLKTTSSLFTPQFPTYNYRNVHLALLQKNIKPKKQARSRHETKSNRPASSNNVSLLNSNLNNDTSSISSANLKEQRQKKTRIKITTLKDHLDCERANPHSIAVDCLNNALKHGTIDQLLLEQIVVLPAKDYTLYQSRPGPTRPGFRQFPSQPLDLTGLNVIVTGVCESFEPETVMHYLKSMKANVSKSVTKKIHLAIVGVNAGGSKITKLHEQQVPMIDEENLIKLLHLIAAQCNQNVINS